MLQNERGGSLSSREGSNSSSFEFPVFQILHMRHLLMHLYVVMIAASSMFLHSAFVGLKKPLQIQLPVQFSFNIIASIPPVFRNLS